MFSYSASRVTPLSGPISPHTNYAFILPCRYCCSGDIYVLTILVIFQVLSAY
ncbi:hypothetical protein K503DRAFT_806608 [Rhizopogon vinicolor AM-OR11-026]|uniref:Uncharacterized protein n=1 Tax=Rhizopogon vinicolor AM-OR11-026 TaxID=1314800 RepID=A0A1B7ME40_9AGAM|nr:hypothetical protein K503DRAFT_806608 [Rhizopogon vinicolor AM-OR11-026]